MSTAKQKSIQSNQFTRRVRIASIHDDDRALCASRTTHRDRSRRIHTLNVFIVAR
jgi:hypothetical protein